MKTPTKKMLLVEDHPIIQRMVKKIYKDAEVIIDVASNGAEALELATKENYNLILMDLGLPDVDGLTIIETIRGNEKNQSKRVPIVVLTAHSDEELKRRSLEIGISEYIVKPLTLEKSQELLHKYLRLPISQ